MVDVVKWMFQLINMLQEKLFLLEQRTSKTRPAQERKQTMEDWEKLTKFRTTAARVVTNQMKLKALTKLLWAKGVHTFTIYSYKFSWSGKDTENFTKKTFIKLHTLCPRIAGRDDQHRMRI